MEELYGQIPLTWEEIDRIHQYMDAAAHLYGLVSLDELFSQSARGLQLRQRLAPENQLSFFEEPHRKPKLTIVGVPSRNGLCPCGSGRKYKNCCGKENQLSKWLLSNQPEPDGKSGRLSAAMGERIGLTADSTEPTGGGQFNWKKKILVFLKRR